MFLFKIEALANPGITDTDNVLAINYRLEVMGTLNKSEPGHDVSITFLVKQSKKNQRTPLIFH
jgi:hypothetical protein